MEYSPNPFERIKQYQTNKKNLFRCDDPEKMADEIMETYRQATKLGYQFTQQDHGIRFCAMVVKQPELLETLVKRIESDEIVDLEGNPIKE